MTDMTGNAGKLRSFVRDLVPEPSADSDEFLDALRDMRLLAIEVRHTTLTLMHTAYEEGATLDEIGDSLGVTKQSVHYHLSRRSSAPLDDPNVLRLF